MVRFKRLIVCPGFYTQRPWNDMWPYFLSQIQMEYGCDLRYVWSTDSSYPDASKVETVITFAIPQHDRPDLMVDWVCSIPKHVKVIGYLRDLHTFGRRNVMDAMRKCLDRYDVILTSANQPFQDMWPEYYEKTMVFPDFFAPHQRYACLPFNKNPIKMCLLSGAYNPEVYTLRDYIRNHGDGKKIVWVPPPYNGEHEYIGDMYARLLNRFTCCVTESGVCGYVVTKCFEIPASGSLLLANRIPDMDTFGFLPGKHYVDVNRDNVLETIDTVLADPDKYDRIKKAGRKFVVENHSVKNRVCEFKNVLAKVEA